MKEVATNTTEKQSMHFGRPHMYDTNINREIAPSSQGYDNAFLKTWKREISNKSGKHDI